MALQIPSVKAGVSYISSLVANLEVKLCKEIDGKVENVNDYRLKLLNDETGDTLNSCQMKESLVTDYLIAGNGYMYINKHRNKINSLHYVESLKVTAIHNNDPIFKDHKLRVNGQEYELYNFVIFAQNSKDGVIGKGLLDECNNLLELGYNTLAFSNNNIKAGGIKRGVVKSVKKLTQEAIDHLKAAWSNLYGTNNTSSAIILNDGLDFKELSQTSAEMQILENRRQNDSDILNILKVPQNILNGTATNEQYNNFICTTIIPILVQLECAFNKALLLESEKADGYFFSFETKGLLKGNIKERFEAYQVAIDAGFLMPSECRYFEDYDYIEGLDIIKMSLGNIIYNPNTKETYVPNTGQLINSPSTDKKEVNNDENRS
ncbi:phage portal protein [Romboutsia timonensis]|uniref:phage portal protein n=1 Tax=Romboutsia timonensis TaxID=1776391 RepID=UPI002A7F97E3|nr:phage portal protein [Romboutsia timonensis]MDY3960176.1 phage portal protein [Romboutsia timonensis]